MRKALILAAALALVAGCGGGGGGTKQSASADLGGSGGATLTPASAPFLLRLDTAFDSPAWTAFDALLRKLPDGTKLYSSIGGSGTDFERDVKPVLGPEIDVLALTVDDLGKNAFVGLTQPRDDAGFQQLLAKGSSPPVTEQIEGWRVIADKQATIDRFKQARKDGALADSDAYKAATASLPAGSLATLFLDGQALTKTIAAQAKTGTGPLPGVGKLGWLAGALRAEEKGFAVDLRLEGDGLAATEYTPELPAEVPADVWLLVDFKGLDTALDQLRQMPAVSQQLGSAAQALGGLIDDVVSLFKGEGALYARSPGASPEYTLVLKVADEQAASSTLDRLTTVLGAAGQQVPESVTVAGVAVKKISLGSITLYYGVFDGKVVVTNAESGIEGLKAGGDRLADSTAWKDAAAATDLPDATTGLLYADVPRVVPLAEQLAKNSTPLPAIVTANLSHLGGALLYGSVDKSVLSVKGFVSVS